MHPSLVLCRPAADIRSILTKYGTWPLCYETRDVRISGAVHADLTWASRSWVDEQSSRDMTPRRLVCGNVSEELAASIFRP
jgi:hypothetical protein